ncbi:hypothetical protein MAPG_10019 [Magnaporthiopsis poae ATCC 64411]|uniref:ubiquitinyl hydrolase 1 n=1 Tax=Magnaporthiopsis poae (strain ATCC 64411 / 73-15) TaxID=644358 RepID=A0A0C4EBH2_MAGP6|nr:hypothetical protein MAPG_10019 [Magnaporthiopsis poae ATCC 64411]
MPCGTADQERRRRLAQHSSMVALICHATFDVDAALAPSVFSDGAESALLIEASIRAAELAPSQLPDHPTTPILDLLLHRWRRVSYEAEPRLKDLIVDRDSPCLDMAIRAVWPSYTRGEKWSAAPAPHRHVLVTRLPATSGRDPLSLQYNLLTGDFMVGGSPFSPLPANFQMHATYDRMFGSAAFTVVPSYMRSQGMQHMATSMYHGHELHFAMLDWSGSLVIRSEKGGTTYELIPVESLRGDFPDRLLDGYAHWLVLGRRRIEFRPIDMAWQTLEDVGSSSEGYYVLDLGDAAAAAAAARMTKANSSIETVGTHSETARVVHSIFRPLESPRFIEMAFDRGRSVLNISLERLRLSFSLASGGSTIASEQYRGYCVDEDQSIGALSGLESKLVLRRSYDGQLDARLVLIPAGYISFVAGPDGRARSTSIDTGPGDRVQHHVFRIDTMLGCLRDGGAVSSKLLLCHLHAITTHCLPDRLTGRTGTEEALRILSSAAVQRTSQLQLQDEEVERLNLIANISPSWGSDRNIPAIVTWPCTAPRVAQDGAFRELAQAIVDVPMSPQHSFLLRRAAARMSAYRAPLYVGAGRPQPTAERQAVGYAGYSDAQDWESELEVCRLARHIINDEGQAVLLHSFPPQDVVFFAQCPLAGRSAWGDPGLTAEFNTGWISDPKQISIDTWCGVLQEINSLRRGNPPGNHRYRLILFFAGLLFAPMASLGVVQLLLVVATAPIVRKIDAARGEPLDPPVVVDLVEALANAATHTDHQVRLEDMKACFAALLEQVSKLPLSSRQSPEKSKVTQAHMSEEPAGRRGFLSVDDMFGRSKPPARRPPRWPFARRHDVPKTSNEPPQPKLLHLLGVLQGMARFEHERRYVKELEQGVGALQGSDTRRLWDPDRRRRPLGHLGAHQGEADNMLATVSDVLDAATTTTTTTTTQGGPGGEPAQPSLPPGPSGSVYAAIRHALSGTTDPTAAAAAGKSNGAPGDAQLEKPLSLALRLPEVTPMLLLERLSRRHRAKLSDEWLRCLVDYAVSLTALQRAERMLRAVDDDKLLAKELQNVGHRGWDPNAFPDWLLLEVEMDILIRPVQALIASAMMRPPSARSHVMQLNMGEGKSSVIVPMVASPLADGSRLVRIIVAKPQSKQMLHTLTRALGGLLDRRVYQLPPFSRGSGYNTEPSRLAALRADCVACLESGGVLLAQPEHILSLRLSGLEAALLATDGPGKDALFRLQHFFDRKSRDIIDESDEILSTKSELIYTMGSQDAVDLGPLRWRMIQSVLGLVAEIAPAIGKQYPDMVEVGSLGLEGRFPRIRVLNEAGATVLTNRLVQRIFDGGLAGYTHVAGRQQHVKDAMFRYVMQLEPGADDIAVVEAAEELQQPLFLLRGLIACRVLCFALQKRWRVNYGRTDDRNPPTGLAVPFRAKDLPVPQAEFSHPDVVIILTCLTYYYGGLRDDELFRLIERLSLSADGEREYLAWVQSTPDGISPGLGGLGDINTNDHEHCIAEVFPRLRHLRMAINYYLSSILFSREMREYPQKLSESGWSIAATRAHPATGFSGTNDTKYLLPLGIKSLDLKEQRHTNALVLNHLLRPDNTVQDVPAGELPAAALPGHGPSLTLQLLRHVVESPSPIRVIIDAGAQIVELDNAETARQWLDLVPAAEASAAVFFNSDEEMCVVSRDGTTQPFLTSPYATNTESCLVYIDDAHTRGTDLRLPNDYRAAVTLGPALTRDRIVQACMRMRELGRGQSVVFLMPVEIRQKITKLRDIPPDGHIEVADVLAWSISETWREVGQLTPLWAVQGRRHRRQQRLWGRANKRDYYELSRDMATKFLERESLTLRERYHSSHRSRASQKILARAIAARVTAARVTASAVPDVLKSETARIRERCDALGVGKQRHAVSLEKEEERELLAEALKAGVQKTLPRGVEALEPSLHKDVEAFVATGTIPDGSPAFLPAFRALAGSSVANLVRGLPGGGLVCPPRHARLFATADFARTVRLPPLTDAAPDIMDSYQRPVQWVVTAVPAPPAPLDEATVVLLSPWEADRLMPTFRSGKTLYLRTYDDYVETCRLLGVPYRAGAGAEGDDKGKETEGFGRDAVPFFLGLFGKIRHPSADLSCTDIGHILAGDVLRPSYFSGPMRTR